MKNILTFIFLSSLLVGCEQKYVIKDGKVYLKGANEANGGFERLVDSADAKTFKSLDFNCDYDFTFGKDKSSLFIDGNRMEGIDPNTFVFVGNYIFRDKNSAYFFGFYNNLNDCRIDSVSPDNIQLLMYPWARAGNKLIWGKKAFTVDDLKYFEPIDENWGKTKSHIIYNDGILNAVDYETFKIINSYSCKDKYHKFEFGKIVREGN